MTAAAADLADCRRLLRAGSKSFWVASKLLPRTVRDPACALYAFCRQADDAVDIDAGGLQAIVRLRARLDAVYAGTPQPWPADRALAVIAQRHALPRIALDALLEGFEWDATGRRFDRFDDLLDYAARVAGTVGVLMAALMGARSAEALARACDLGVAMQLTNIARDVGEDARNGRLYLPQAWLREAGLDPDDWLAAPQFDARLAGVIRRLLAEADRLYAQVDAGIALLPPACRPGIQAARLLYAEIGHELMRRGCDSVSQRAIVPAGRKLALLMQAAARRPGLHAGSAPGPAPLAATRFLIDATLALPVPALAAALPSPPQPPPWWRIGARAVWVLELFERLEREEREAQRRRHGQRARAALQFAAEP